MRVAIDARPAVSRDKTGIGYYTWHLLRLLPELDPGTDYGPTDVHPHPNPMGAIGCSSADPPEVNDYYRQGRDLFIKEMEAVIDQVAILVEKGLNEVTERIALGKREIAEEVAKLPAAEREVGELPETYPTGQ